MRWIAIVAACTVVVVEIGLRAAAPALRDPVLWQNEEVNHKYHQMLELAEDRGADTVFVGSSLVGVGLDPARYGAIVGIERPAYNAALLSSSLGMQALWLEHFVVPLLHPDTVVIGVSSRELNRNDGSLDTADRLFATTTPVREAREELSLSEQAEDVLRRTSYLFRYREVLREPLRMLDDDPLPPELAVTDLGMTTAVLHRDFEPFDRELLARFGRTQRFRLARSRLGQLATMAWALTTGGADVVILDMPITQEAVDLMPQRAADLQRTSAALRQVAADVGARYVPTGVWGTEDFSDEWHVNGRGARRLTELLAEQLR